jgi:hypothetical protein
MVFLTAEELRRLTGRKRFRAQREALDRLGIRYTVAATGEPLVLLAALDEPSGKARNRRPRWDRMLA